MLRSATLPSPQLGSRALFPSLQASAYLAHAAISPPSAAVRAAVETYLSYSADAGVRGFGQALEQREVVRARLARFIHAPSPDDVAFVQNTGAALAAVASGLSLKAGDRIVLLRGEYPSNVHPFREVALRAGAEVVFVDGMDFVRDEARAREALRRELVRSPKLLAVSAVQFQTGYQMPLRWLGDECARNGVRLCVDAVQGLGAVPIDVQACGADFLACGAHKWLMGLDGVGVLYIRPERRSELHPVMVGAFSYEESMRMLMGEANQLRYDRPMLPNTRVFEGGMLSSASIAALDASSSCIEQIGIEAIYGHLQRYHDLLEPKLVALGLTSLRATEGTGARSGTLSFELPEGIDPLAFVEAMGERGVVASCPDGLLRMAPHWPNTLDEVPIVEGAVSEVLELLRT